MEHLFFDFLLTIFIDGIEKPIDLFDDHSLIFDNPRTKDEIRSIASLVRDMCPNDIPPNFNVFNPDGSQLTVSDFLELFYEFKKSCTYVSDRKSKMIFTDIYEELASYWVIIRCKKDTLSPTPIELFPRTTNVFGISLEPEDAIKTKLYKFCFNRMMLLTFLSLKNNAAFFLQKGYAHSTPLENIFEMYTSNISTMAFNFAYTNFVTEIKYTSMITELSKFLTAINDSAEMINNKLSSKSFMERLDYISEILSTYYSETDYRMKILLLTSIIEMVLTHNPDNSRFNVEDSITKQFVKNCLVLLSLDNPELNVETEHILLKSIYSLRSSIVHGDFDNIPKIQKNMSKYMKENPIKGIFLEVELGFSEYNELAFFYTYIITRLENICHLCIINMLKRERLIAILKN